MPMSQDEAHGKCFSGIVNMLLCTRTLPTHPTPSPENDQITPTSKHQSFKDLISNEPDEDISSKPGVVARLMGLETMPPKDGNLGSYLRSRSVNFVDYLYSFDDLITGKPQHRRVKTSLSFREVPVNFEKGNALEKEKGDQILEKTRVSNNRQAKQKKVHGDSRNGGNFIIKKQSRISDEPQGEIHARSSLKIDDTRKRNGTERMKRGSNDVQLGLNNKLRNKKKKKRLGNRKKHDESYPESTSSVSDGCLKDSSMHLKVHKSGHKEQTSLMKHISKFNNEVDARFDKEVSLASRRNLDKKTRFDLDSEGYIKILGNVKMLVEDDIIRGNSWIVMKFEDLEETCKYLGESILELLLSYLTHELIVQFDISRN